MPALRPLALSPLFLALLAAPLVAQQLETGTRVRGEAAAGPFAGRVGWASADSLAIVQRDDTLLDGNDSELEGLKYLAAGTVFIGGAALGAIVGALVKSSRWTRVRPSGLGVSLSF